MNKGTPTHLNSVFEIDVWIDDRHSDYRSLEIVAYPMFVVRYHRNGEKSGKIDSKHMVASLRLPIASLVRDEKEFRALMGHVGRTTIGIDADCWGPEDVEILFGKVLGACVMKVMVDACRNEFNGRDTSGVRYRASRPSSRRGIQCCEALAATLKTSPNKRGSILVHNETGHIAHVNGLWVNPEDHWSNTAAQ